MAYVDSTMFPVATDMSGAYVVIGPGGMRQLHWHTNFNEWQYVINGSVETGVFLGPGEFTSAVLQAGDLGFAPRGSGHYIRNPNNSPVTMVLIFDAGVFTNVDINNFLGAVPPSWAAASLGISTAAAKAFNYSRPTFAPAVRVPKQG